MLKISREIAKVCLQYRRPITCSNRTVCGDIGEMYTRRLVYQHGISRQLLKRMSDENIKSLMHGV